MVARNKIYISTCNFKKKYDNDLNQILDNLPEKYNNYEISSGHESIFTDFEKLIKKKVNGYDFLLHNYPLGEQNNLLVNLSEFDKNRRIMVEKYIERMIDLTYKLDQDYFSFHAGWIINNNGNSNNNSAKIHQKALNLFIASFGKINSYSNDRGIKLGIENHVVIKGNEEKLILYDISDYEKLFRAIDDDNICLHLDFGHLKITSETFGFDKEEFINRFQDRVYAVHVHDNDGHIDNHDVITERSYFLKYLNKLRNLKYIILETWDCKENIDDMIKIIKSYN